MFPTKNANLRTGVWVLAIALTFIAGCQSAFEWKNSKAPAPAVVYPNTGSPMFSIQSTGLRIPQAGYQGSEVTFTGNCQNNGNATIQWFIPGSQNETGVRITKSFSTVGPVTIKAVCYGIQQLTSEIKIDVYYPGSGGTCLPTQTNCNGGPAPTPGQYK
jgi:hypothetical protein